MDKTVTLKLQDAKNILYAMDQALPELEELCHQGDIKESIPDGIEQAMAKLQEALS